MYISEFRKEVLRYFWYGIKIQQEKYISHCRHLAVVIFAPYSGFGPDVLKAEKKTLPWLYQV